MAGDLTTILLAAIALGVWGILARMAGRDALNAISPPLRIKQVKRAARRAWRWARGP